MNPNPVIVELRRITRRRGLHALEKALFRSLWLALAGLACGLIVRLLGRPVPWPTEIGTVSLLALLGLVVTLARRPSPARLARWLDHHFGLHEQIATAYEVGQRGEPTGDLQHRLIAQASGTLRRLRRHPALTPGFPLREVETFLALVLITGGLWLLLDTGTHLPAVVPRQLPPTIEEPAAELVRSPSPRLPPEIREAVARLAEALRQNPLTRGAGEALSEGDTAGAADALRALADRVDQLTPQERADLADALRGASSSLAGDLPGVRKALDRAADRLEHGSDAKAAEALEALAREIDALGERQQPAIAGTNGNQEGVAGQPEAAGSANATNPGASDEAGQPAGDHSGTGTGDSAGEGTSDQTQATAPPEELGTEGVPLELDPGEQGPPTSQPARDSENPAGPPQRARGFTRGGAPDPSVVRTGADPQRYPWELRGTVRDYFQPAP
ncbi:MAG: hypothetical protein M5U01_14015 [Ardenticatenaceae bacterium]|nr:hypothetical protein [Ardenticatenaceae bacterium]